MPEQYPDTWVVVWKMHNENPHVNVYDSLDEARTWYDRLCDLFTPYSALEWCRLGQLAYIAEKRGEGPT